MNEPEPIQWTEARDKIGELQAAVETGFGPTPRQEREILKDRARILAREPEAADVETDWLEVIEFDLAGESYALPLAQVREVSLLKELTPVPCTPPFVLGIINLRGEIRVVIDLKKFFDLPEKGITDLNKIIMIQNDEMQLGILADFIRNVRRVRIADLQPALPTMTGIRADYLRGVTSDRLVVLDSGKILSDKRIIVDEQPRS
jgi:purine-binding chemotaxis protein CheW